MVVDRTTDAIAHFIGLFGQKLEELRDRQVYDAFEAQRHDVELDPLESVEVPLEEKYTLLRTDPKPLPTPLTDLPKGATTIESIGFSTPFAPGLPTLWFPLPEPDLPRGQAGPEISNELTLDVLPITHAPSSMVTVTQQTAILSDNDRLGQGAFRDPATHMHELKELGEFALSLHAPGGPGAGEIADAASVEALNTALAAFTVAEVEGVVTFLQHGAPGPVSILNGTLSDDLPDWKDHLPEYHRAETQEEEGEPLSVRDLPEAYKPNPDMPEGHTLVTGGNLLANEAYLSISHVDAPFIAVGGAWTSQQIVSQIAAVIDHDTGPGASPSGRTDLFQSVRIEGTSRPAEWQAGRDPEGNGPTEILIDYVPHDLVIANYLQQVIQLMDNDQFGMSITGANSALIMGDNTVVNATKLFTAGFAYDLILVGGDFIQIESIHQTMVLRDNDHIDTGAGSGTPSKALDANALDKVQDHGVAKDGEAVRGQDISIDGDPFGDPEPDMPTVPEEDHAAGPPPDNLVLNEARLVSNGMDARAELPERLAELLSDPDIGLRELQDRLSNDPALAGLEQARVLKIDGDLVQTTTINQIIMASDNDDIIPPEHLPAGMEILAGSNALLNAATIASHGVDSNVMADAGYSDLLIHQAELLDEADSFDVPASDLATEAVAFLMDDGTSGTGTSVQSSEGFQNSHDVDSYDLMASAVV